MPTHLCRISHPRMISEQSIASSLLFNQMGTAATLDANSVGWRLRDYLPSSLDSLNMISKGH
ncbi:hypothetical protein ASPCADRAFT_203663 [Aspergillus carbonarius ITEM 5010]|uniref:Uncharacterized protein n=1 Tax=Aspergillus carbonarius (strain ITEM 5010) TaxID=602072 RepID=A0A1R3RZB5_ASPC5|nr:hypothetical protein ASPCADRAFT_203663 [Aspergillus carbonarius ITEM 5010]